MRIHNIFFSFDFPMADDDDDDEIKQFSTNSPSTLRCCSPYERIIHACKCGFQSSDRMLEYGPVKLNIGDLCTLIPPNYDTSQCQLSVTHPNFFRGWLIDKVYIYTQKQLSKCVLMNNEVYSCVSVQSYSLYCCTVGNRSCIVEIIYFQWRNFLC